MGTPAEAITRHYRGDWSGNQGLIPAPGHSAQDRGVSVKDAENGDVIFHSFNGGDWREIKDECRRLGLIGERDRSVDRGTCASPAKVFYDYRDESGEILFRVERRGKSAAPPFLQHGPDGKGDFYAAKRCMTGVRRVPYRLPELLAADQRAIVYICEGEKDADRLAREGLIATTNPGGAGKFTADLARHFSGRRVVALQDNDEAGAAHVASVLQVLDGIADQTAVLLLPGLGPKGDVSDWLDAGGSVESLNALAGASLEQDVPASSPNRAKPTNSKNEPPSEDDIALEFTERHRDTLRFDHDIGAWFEFDGSQWRRNNNHRAFTYAREIARQHGAAGKANFAAGVERFARADCAHAVSASQWDCDPMRLGTPGGTVDLRTGKLTASRPADYITKLAGCTPEQGEPTLWLRFLNEALDGDQDAIRFLKLWAGYCLTGDTREHALLFLHGLAGTGKTVFLNTLATVLGDYAVTAAMETFTASKFDRHSTELAMLRGARLVTASETEEGRSWAEAKIKQMTGGDPITARFMRQDNFTFRPQFKLTIVGNHAPRLTNPDDAMRRRFNILGFNVKPSAPDLQLETKLRAEHGRILAWAIAGCLEWQAHGLIRPAAVADATSEYFAGEDLMGQWIADCCEVRAGAFELPAKLYRDWQRYADEHGEAPGTAIGFGKKMSKRGLGAKVRNGIRSHQGIQLRGAFDAH